MGIAWQQEANPYLQIHSVYYDTKGKPRSYSKESADVGGDSIAELKQDLKYMKLALKKYILWGGDKFPEEYKPE